MNLSRKKKSIQDTEAGVEESKVMVKPGLEGKAGRGHCKARMGAGQTN